MEEKKLEQSEKKIVDLILTEELSEFAIEKIVEALEMKKYLVTAVLPNTPQSENFGTFLMRFWDFEKSPYVREKKIVGQSIHQRYVRTMQQRVKAYWLPLFGNRILGSITREDIKNAMWSFATKKQKVRTRKKDAEGNWVYVYKKLSAETVNQVVRSATCALKWAYHNGLTKNDCSSGLIYCHVVPEKRKILSMRQAKRVFSYEWKNKSYMLANLTAMFTGMRIGEIQALQIQDIGKDRIFIRHNWARFDGLKTPKNGDCREIKIPKILREMLLEQAYRNPFGIEKYDFIFWGYCRSVPCGARHFNEALHEVVKELKIKDWKKITFHSWRHFFTANMADHVDERKLQLATGHKTLEILEHYASHESEKTIKELGSVAEKIFLPLVKTA